jgi:hypothetical protein
VTDREITISHEGCTRTIPRPSWYRPDGPPELARAKPEPKRTVMSQHDTRIREGFWTTTFYDDGSGHCRLSERFDEPCEQEMLPAQLQAQEAFEKHGPKGWKWGPRR